SVARTRPSAPRPSRAARRRRAPAGRGRAPWAYGNSRRGAGGRRRAALPGDAVVLLVNPPVLEIVEVLAGSIARRDERPGGTEPHRQLRGSANPGAERPPAPLTWRSWPRGTSPRPR